MKITFLMIIWAELKNYSDFKTDIVIALNYHDVKGGGFYPKIKLVKKEHTMEINEVIMKLHFMWAISTLYCKWE